MSVAVDTSVLVAALLSWHEFHDRAATAIESVLRLRRLVLPVPALVESYSVMTRLPPPHRLAPTDAFVLLRDSFGGVRLTGIPADDIWQFLDDCAAHRIAGGRAYDAVIVRAALAAKATELLTFNARDFESFADQITVIVP